MKTLLMGMFGVLASHAAHANEFYFGGSVGTSSAEFDWTSQISDFASSGNKTTTSPDGALLGAFIGYEFAKYKRLNLRIEGNYYHSKIETSDISPGGFGGFNDDDTFVSEIDGLYSASLILSQPLDEDWSILYKGGAALGSVSIEASDVTYGHMSSSELHPGWLAGVGLEYHVSESFTLRGEYEYINLMEKTHYGSSSVSGNENVFRVAPNGIQILSAKIQYNF